jgi:hypothetical protein
MVPLLSPLHVAFVNVVVKAGVAGVASTALVVTSQTAALLSVMVNVYVPTVATDTVYGPVTPAAGAPIGVPFNIV